MLPISRADARTANSGQALLPTSISSDPSSTGTSLLTSRSASSATSTRPSSKAGNPILSSKPCWKPSPLRSPSPLRNSPARTASSSSITSSLHTTCDFHSNNGSRKNPTPELVPAKPAETPDSGFWITPGFSRKSCQGLHAELISTVRAEPKVARYCRERMPKERERPGPSRSCHLMLREVEDEFSGDQKLCLAGQKTTVKHA